MLLYIILAFLSFPLPSLSAEKRTYETQYATIHYSSENGLLEFGRKIGGPSALLNRDPERAHSKIKEDVDRITFRVRTLLDMYPPGFHFNIQVMENNKEIKDAYREIGKQGAAPIAFYAQKSQTIYVSVDKLSDGILAHEISHAVINFYFSVPPPAQMQEILAQYVDKHLRDENITP